MAARRTVLVVDDRIPTPDQDSGSACAFSWLTILSQAGFRVVFLPCDLRDAGRYSQAVRALGVTVPEEGSFASIEEALDRLAPEADIAILSRAPVAQRLFDRLRSVSPRTRIVFNTVDLHHLRMRREAELTGDPDQARAAEDMRVVELGLVERADATVVVSAYERDLLGKLLPRADVHHIPILREVPADGEGVAVRLPAFLSRLVPVPRGRRDIVFVGGFSHAPNGDGIRWFVAEVWPLVLEAGLDRRLLIAGSHMPPGIMGLASRTIATLGHVEDLAGLFAKARVSIAPLRFGAGVKGKVVSSLGRGVPVVATRMAVEGTGLVHGRDVLAVETPAEMAAAIVRLCGDDRLWRRLSRHARRTFLRTHSLEAGRSKIMGLLDGLAARP